MPFSIVFFFWVGGGGGGGARWGEGASPVQVKIPSY